MLGVLNATSRVNAHGSRRAARARRARVAKAGIAAMRTGPRPPATPDDPCGVPIPSGDSGSIREGCDGIIASSPSGPKRPGERSLDAPLNPLLAPWDAPFGLPPFDLVRPEHFMPAFERAMREHRDELARI